MRPVVSVKACVGCDVDVLYGRWYGVPVCKWVVILLGGFTHIASTSVVFECVDSGDDIAIVS